MDLAAKDIDAILVTHQHGDHGGGAKQAQKRWGIPVYANPRTAEELGLLPELWRPFGPLEAISISPDLAVLPVPVPHSGSDNVAFVASHAGQRAAFITDLGSWTEELVRHVRGCEHISIEANYDARMLEDGPYPRSLKERIGGPGGHLSNDQTGQFLAEVVDASTDSITLTHLSQKNNRPHLAESTVLFYIDEVFQGDIRISAQDGPEFTLHLGDGTEQPSHRMVLPRQRREDS